MALGLGYFPFRGSRVCLGLALGLGSRPRRIYIRVDMYPVMGDLALESRGTGSARYPVPHLFA